ncbi:DeoR/GlpR transcriptional regulator [Anaerococcus sp. AGMB00486]|uniref:DeoR/GlpR transcriptional regulator n=1 Tax=Anaerococcus faecalis TaxID=2742993 RepID=A0ABX2NC11_9FIRM|nr:DeoR/GlpR family DNA-binding transcription regulator [Anaerococcus faecalis]NVF12249.1 DeoR/GlpR transcriptional regulator [Anaerococcus faecalis]
MFLEERLSFITNKLNEKNRVNVSDLSEQLEVSEVTIRKDLKELEDRKIAIRTHGGAIKVKEHVLENPIDNKILDNIGLKKIIAKKARKYLRDDITIFLDAGTTTRMLIEYISKLKNVTVITYDLDIATLLSKYNSINTYLLGGYIEKKTRTSLSIEGFQNLSSFHGDICFIGTDAFDDDYVYSTSENKGKIKNMMIVNSEISILLCDSTKYGKTGLYSFYKSKNFDYFISDKKIEGLSNV